MTKEQFEREKNYRAALSIAKAMLSQGLISAREYGKIDTILIKNTDHLWAVYAQNCLDVCGIQRYHVPPERRDFLCEV
jgi:hypothetical protein